jgi:hypothetical protein
MDVDGMTLSNDHAVPVPVHPIDERLARLEAENILLKSIIASLAAFADPQAKVAIVRKLTGPPAALTAPALSFPAQEEVLARTARDLLRMIAAGASGGG